LEGHPERKKCRHHLNAVPGRIHGTVRLWIRAFVSCECDNPRKSIFAQAVRPSHSCAVIGKGRGAIMTLLPADWQASGDEGCAKMFADCRLNNAASESVQRLRRRQTSICQHVI
jgi:hypothetical protein